MAEEVTTTTDVDAQPEQVWDLLARFREYEFWHPRFERVTTQTDWSTKLKLHVRRPGRRSLRLTGSLLEFGRPQLIKWTGAHPIYGLLNVTYAVRCAPLESGRTRLEQSTKVGGFFKRRAALAAEEVMAEIGAAAGPAIQAGRRHETEPAA